MIALPLLGEHAFALVLLWGIVVLPGLALVAFFRAGAGLLAAPLFGVVFWNLALYLFPFAGGLDLAGALLAAGCLATWIHKGRKVRLGIPRRNFVPRSTWFLLLASLPFTTTLWFHYVPAGMDASMHTTAAALIARAHGLPANYAPFTPEVPFSTVNLGLPAVAAIAIRCGGEPAAVLLAAHHLTFTCLLLATYILLRWWVPRNSAAVVAVLSVWLARAAQASIDWGGFPTVLSVAVGILATRLLLQQSRRYTWRLALATGTTIAALPMIHGVGAGTWIYCAGIWITFTTWMISRSPARTLASQAVAGVWALFFLFTYWISGHLDVGPAEMATTRAFAQQFAPPEQDWTALFSSFAFLRKESGTLLAIIGMLSCLLVVCRRPRWAFLPLLGAFVTLPLLIANARWWILPGSFVIYPDRVLYWTGPISAVAMALAWRTVSKTLRASNGAWVMAFGLLIVAGYFHNSFYQKSVREIFVTQDGWEALVWSKQHLQPGRHFVHAEYKTAASYLPGVALIACDGAHHHHFIGQKFTEAYQQRIPTHLFLENIPPNEDQLSAGKIVFRNRSVTILETPIRAPSVSAGLGDTLR